MKEDLILKIVKVARLYSIFTMLVALLTIFLFGVSIDVVVIFALAIMLIVVTTIRTKEANE